MKRLLFAALAGGLFGAGLLISGMTDTTRVQGWLDVFGDWDATLAFVMGGAILPMTLAWRVAARRTSPVLGGTFPAPVRSGVTAGLVVGSVLFGMGWALAGLCPGPAMASLGYGGIGGLVFLLAMLAGMLIAPPVRTRIDKWSAHKNESQMEIRALTPDYAVSPQIALTDLAAIKAAGYTTVIDNRPDGEIPAELSAKEMARAAEAAGLAFVLNPVIAGALSSMNVEVQRAAIEAAPGPVFAYCASGNRSSILWLMMQAGERDADSLIAITAQHGYDHRGLKGQLEALAQAKG